MGKNTKISWATHTMNIVIGCVEVSEACRNCYARELAKRYGWAKWGKDEDRHQMAESYWKQPAKWNREAQEAGVRARVFCSSLADVFEDHRDLVAPRARLWPIIEATPWLDWMLLTKRAENIARFAPPKWQNEGWPRNAWPGVTAEDQKNADKRIPELLKVPAPVLWISAEPLLGPIDFEPWLRSQPDLERGYPHELPTIDWIIVGGESGEDARMMRPEWVQSILSQCHAHGVAFHHKQKGEALARAMGCKDKAGKDPAEWPKWMQIQEFPVLADAR